MQWKQEHLYFELIEKIINEEEVRAPSLETFILKAQTEKGANIRIKNGQEIQIKFNDILTHWENRPVGEKFSFENLNCSDDNRIKANIYEKLKETGADDREINKLLRKVIFSIFLSTKCFFSI